MGDVNEAAADIRNNWLPATRDLGLIASGTERVRTNQATQMLAGSLEEAAEIRGRMPGIVRARDKAWKHYRADHHAGEERRLADAYLEAWNRYEEMTKTWRGMLDAHDPGGERPLQRKSCSRSSTRSARCRPRSWI